MLKWVRLFSEGNVTERTANVEQHSCSSWQSNAEELVGDEDDSSTVNRINVEDFFDNLSFSHTSTAEPGNIWKGVRCGAHTLELAIEDALKEYCLRDVISSARCICKNLKNVRLRAFEKAKTDKANLGQSH